MLKITITEVALIFGAMPDEVLRVVNRLSLEVQEMNGKFRVTAAPKKLFYLLHELARDFDIEIV